MPTILKPLVPHRVLTGSTLFVACAGVAVRKSFLCVIFDVGPVLEAVGSIMRRHILLWPGCWRKIILSLSIQLPAMSIMAAVGDELIDDFH